MTPRVQAEIFIQTLEEMCDHERERKKARLRLQLKAHVRRFVEEFRTDFPSSMRASDWTPQGRRTARDPARHLRAD